MRFFVVLLDNPIVLLKFIQIISLHFYLYVMIRNIFIGFLFKLFCFSVLCRRLVWPLSLPYHLIATGAFVLVLGLIFRLYCCLYIFCLRLIFRRSRETLVQYLHICTHTGYNVQFIYFTRFPFLSILLSFDFPSYRLLCVCSSFLLLFFLHVLNTFFVWGAGWIFAGSAFAKNQLSLMEWNAHTHTHPVACTSSQTSDNDYSSNNEDEKCSNEF